MELHERVERVDSRDGLIEFVRALRRDLEGSDADWENPDLPRYLGAVAAWLEDMDGYFANRGEAVPDPPSWRLFAQVLIAAKYYE